MGQNSLLWCSPDGVRHLARGSLVLLVYIQGSAVQGCDCGLSMLHLAGYMHSTIFMHYVEK